MLVLRSQMLQMMEKSPTQFMMQLSSGEECVLCTLTHYSKKFISISTRWKITLYLQKGFLSSADFGADGFPSSHDLDRGLRRHSFTMRMGMQTGEIKTL
jgi:hypothetical protein